MTDYGYKDRVRRERDEVRVRADRLGAFIDGSVFLKLPSKEQTRLGRQLHHMMGYLQILSERVEWFDEEETPSDDDPMGR